MSAAADTKEQVAALGEKYKYGFVTDIEMERAPKGLSEDTVRFISAKKGEPEWMLDWRLAAFRRWREMTEPNWARVHYPKIDYDDAYYYAAPKSTEKRGSLDEIDPKLLETYKKLGIPLSEQKMLAGVAVDAVFDSVSVATTFKEKLNEAGVIFCPISEAIRDYPDMVRKYLGSVVPVTRQFLRHAEFGGLFRRHIRLYTQGRALPDGAFHLFSHQRQQHGPVRTHADRGRRGFLRFLSGRLHRADARREPVARRGRGIGGAGRRRDQIFHGAELVSGRRKRDRRHLQFRHQARRLPRRALEDLLDAGGNRFGDHLEISELHPARRRQVGEFYSIAITNHYQQADTGTKMIHLGKNTRSRIISKGISAGRAQNTYRGLVSVLSQGGQRA